MRQTGCMFLALAFLAARAACAADDPAAAERFRAALAAKAADLEKSGDAAFLGGRGIYFLASELRHYGRGPFWGEQAATASAATRNPDPLPAFLDFHAQLKGAGIRLVFIPVPGKAALYPDALDSALPAGGRLDAAHAAFYDLLRKDGIEVIDLVPDFIAMRKAGADTHCRLDAHWSPAAMKCAARKAAAAIKAQPWYAGVTPGKTKTTPQALEAEGDIVAMLKALGKLKGPAAPEKLSVEQVALDGNPVKDGARGSPILLIGDSHTLVYHEPLEGIVTQDAGLPDHLAAELGLAPELVANKASGGNAPRITLARPPRWDNLAGAKCVVWCFSVREFTEGAQGWMKVPVIREAAK
jgi:hypothetical protein